MSWTEKTRDALIWSGTGYSILYTISDEVIYAENDEPVSIPVATSYKDWTKKTAGSETWATSHKSKNWTKKDNTPLDWTEKGA